MGHSDRKEGRESLAIGTTLLYKKACIHCIANPLWEASVIMF